METIRANIELLKTDIQQLLDSDEALAKLTFEDLDEALTTKFTFQTPKWDDKIADIKRIKDRYMSLLANDMERLKAIFHWKDHSDWTTKIDMNGYKKYIIEYMKTHVVPKESILSVSIYDMVWQLIRDGSMVLTCNDMMELDIRFLQYIVSRSRYTNPFQNMPSPPHKYDEDDIITKAYMTHCERFWVNALASERFHDLQNDMMICLGMDVNPVLRYMPQKVTVFSDGDLISQIVRHYKDVHISPMIKWRRNMGILIDNKPYNFYDYCKHQEYGPFYTTRFTIELPYMCYAYVDRVEVDVDVYFTGLGSINKEISYVSIGDEIIMSEFSPCDKTNDTYSSNCDGHKLSKTCEKNETPGYYITVSFSSFVEVSAVRIYGKAISFV